MLHDLFQRLSAERRISLAAIAVFITLSTILTVTMLHSGSPWIKTGLAYSTNSVIGYSETEGGAVVHKENRSFLQQMSMFSGATSDVVDKFYIIRPSYAFFSATLAPLVGIFGAALLANWLLWALAAWCAWMLTVRSFSDRRAAVVAVTLVATGMGFSVHILDYSAHLASFATYYLGVLILYSFELWKHPGKPFRVHLLLGLFLAVCCLTYNTGISLVVAYVILAVRANRLHHVVFAAAVGLSAPYLWVAALNLGYALMSGQWVWYDLYNDEQGYLKQSLAGWLAVWSDPLAGIRESFRILFQFLSFESPLTVAAGLAALAAMLVRRPSFAWFGLLVLLLPIAAAMAFAESARSRGYLVFGGSIVLYVAVAGELGRWLAAPSAGWRRAGCTAVAVLVLAQLAWSGAAAFNHLGPLRAYFSGLEFGLPAFGHPPVSVVSLTGLEPTPAWLGGDASFIQAGIFDGGGAEPTGFSLVKRIVLSLAARGLGAGYLVMLVVVWAWGSGFLSRRRAIAVIAVIYLAPSLIMAATVRETHRFVPVDRFGTVGPCDALSYRVTLSEAFRVRAVAAGGPGSVLELFFKPLVPPVHPPRVTLDGRDMPLTVGMDGVWQASFADWAGPLATARTLEIVLRLDGASPRYLGWQRNGLPGRTLTLGGCPVTETPKELPALEVRVRADDGALRLVGF